MTTTLKILGQSSPLATTNTDLYTVPSSTSTVVSSLTVCNTSSSSIKFRIAVRENGEALLTKHYLYYDVSVESNDTFIATVGLTLSASDVVTVYCDSTGLSFHLYGQEVI